MISRRTARFRALYDALPERVRRDADTASRISPRTPTTLASISSVFKASKYPFSRRESTNSVVS